MGKLGVSASGHLQFCISQEGFWGYPWTHWEIETLSMSSICPGMGRRSSSTLEFFPCSVKCCSKCFFWGGQSKPPLYLFLYLYIYLLIYFLFADINIHMHLFFLTLFLFICFSCFLAGEIYRQGEYFLRSHETQRWQLPNLYGLTESYSSEEGKGSQVGKKKKVKCLVPFKKVQKWCSLEERA